MKTVVSGAIAVTLLSLVPTTSFADDQEILIGLIAGTTGAYGAVGIAVVNGTQMAVDEVNAAGGVLGKKIKLEWYNDNADATLSGQFFAKLVSGGAVAIAGSPDTGPVTAELAQRYKIPNIGVVDDGGLTIYKDGPTKPPNPWSFSFGLNTFAWGEKLGEHALRHCPDGLAVLHDPTTYGEGGYFGIKLAYDAAGKEITINETISENWSTGATAGLMPQVTALKDKGIKCVVVWLTPQDQAAFMQDLHTINYDMIVYGNDVTNADDTFSGLAGAQGEGLITAALTSGLHPSPELEAFRKAYTARFNLESSPFAETSYDSIKMFAQVLEAAQSTKPDDLRVQLEKTQGYKGITGTLGFSPKDHITITKDQISLVKYDSASNKWVELVE